MLIWAASARLRPWQRWAVIHASSHRAGPRPRSTGGFQMGKRLCLLLYSIFYNGSSSARPACLVLSRPNVGGARGLQPRKVTRFFPVRPSGSGSVTTRAPDSGNRCCRREWPPLLPRRRTPSCSSRAPTPTPSSRGPRFPTHAHGGRPQRPVPVPTAAFLRSLPPLVLAVPTWLSPSGRLSLATRPPRPLPRQPRKVRGTNPHRCFGEVDR
jgi:hypothetical protein